MTGAGARNGPSALELSPFSRRNVKRPGVVTGKLVAHTAESEKIVMRVESECKGQT